MVLIYSNIAYRAPCEIWRIKYLDDGKTDSVPHWLVSTSLNNFQDKMYSAQYEWQWGESTTWLIADAHKI